MPSSASELVVPRFEEGSSLQWYSPHHIYKDQEKITRGQLKFETEKNLNADTVVILDSMNYIKGYRYQMYCIAREMKSTYCVIFCHTALEAARKFNALNDNPIFSS